jgi:hypothetical protein
MTLMTLTDKYRADLLALVDCYRAVSGKADSSVSVGAFQTDFNFVFRVRRGDNFTIYKAAKLEKYVNDRLEEIRHQLISGADGLHRSQEVFPIQQAESEPATPDRSEESGSLGETHRDEDRERGLPPHYAF